MLFRPGVIVSFVLYVTIVSPVPHESIGDTEYRLPNDTKPISYDIHITTEIPTPPSNFTGTVVITLEVVSDANEIVLHAADLEITEISLVDQKNSLGLKDVEYVLNSENQFLRINPHALLKKGSIYVLTIDYFGRHQEESKGFFTSSYSDLDDRRLEFATTNFEPTYARYAFPCYDEPALKAKFTISLTHFKFYTALSNMPQDGERIEEGNDMATTKFEESPLMSTYTVGFLLTTHRNVSLKEGAVTHRVFSPPIAKSNGENTLKVVIQITHYLENYFDIKYPLPKIDHISIPGMTLTGKDNWGLIVYQFGYLLPTSNNSHLYSMNTHSAIAQELTQQWIGNLVTPKWWSYNWLNEGLAAFYAGKVMQLLYPEYDTDEIELFMDGVKVIEKADNPALMRYVETPKDIKKIFNHYTHFKGAYVCRMFEHALTEKTFKKGIIQYLRDHHYSSADEEDLFKSLQVSATEDRIKYFEEPGQVAKMMRTWTNQKDFPYITVIRDYETGEVRLIQNNLVGSNTTIGLSIQVKHPLWWIPITYATASSPDFEDTTTDFIFPEEETILFDPKESGHILNDNDWLILNKKRIGLYSVNYDEKNWQLIIEALKTDPQKIHVWNRAQLIRDAWKFVKADALSKKILLDLLRYLKNEDEPAPWHEALLVLRNMFEVFVTKQSSEEHTLKEFTRDIIVSVNAKIGIDHISGEHPLWEKMRPNLLSLICQTEITDCNSLIEDKYKEAIEGELEDILMLKEIYCWHLKQANEAEVEDFMNKWLAKRTYPFDKRQRELLQLINCMPSFAFGVNVVSYLGLNLEDVLIMGDEYINP